MKITKKQLKQIIKEEFAKVLNEETPAEERARKAKEEMDRQMGGYDDDYGDDPPAPAKKPAPRPAPKKPAPKKPAPAKKPAAKPKWKPAGPPEKAKGTVPPGSKFTNFKIDKKTKMASVTITDPDGNTAVGTAKFRGNIGAAKRSAEDAAKQALLHKLKRK